MFETLSKPDRVSGFLQALEELNKTFDEATAKARDLGLSEAGLNARRAERIARLEEERANRLQAIDATLTVRGLRLAGDARGADLATFDNTAREEVRQLRETLFQLGLEGTADYADRIIRLEQTLAAERLSIVERYADQQRAVALRLAEVRAPRASDLGTPLAQARLVFAGTVAAVDRTERQRARIALADATDRLNTPLQPILYGGTGGLEGGADLKGKPKPVALGRVFNAAPVFLGNLDLGAGALPTWQSSWRAVQAHDAVRIRGVAQTLVAGTPTVGQAR
ncbi:MAG: hypothetical protein O9325_10085, partial [Roseomonas sp.]|nr:hypothetical protein [Roseomonas sp.]